ncbi:MAG: PqqD family protein [Acidobacteria bacterium]|nr:PqqD family protein [Acidobacteriota bacterium]
MAGKFWTKDTEEMDAVELMPYDHIVFTEFDGGEGVLVDLNTKQYFQLNETAMFVWRRLETGKNFEEIVVEMAGEYEVTREHAEESVRKLLGNLQTFKLVQPRT